MNLTYSTATIKEILKNNREEHRTIFLEAQEGYRKAVIAAFEERLADARKGKRVNTYINLVEPVDQTKEYDRAIRMLELTKDTEIELTEQQFANYVMDQWQWSRQFTTSNSLYSVRAAAKAGEYGEDN